MLFSGWIAEIWIEHIKRLTDLDLLPTTKPMNEKRRLTEAAAKMNVDACNANAITATSKPKQDLPAAWLHVEAANNGWSIYVSKRPMYGARSEPDFVFNSVFDCARKVATLLAPDLAIDCTLESEAIRRHSEGLLVEASRRAEAESKLRDAEHALELMTAGRDQDRVEAKERCDEYQKRIEAVTSAHGQTLVNSFTECEQLKTELAGARARSHAAQLALADLRGETFPQSLDVIRLTRELECATKQRDAAREIAETNRRGKIEAENALRNAQIDAPGLRKENAFLHNENQKLRDVATVYNALNKECEHRLTRIQELESEIAALKLNFIPSMNPPQCGRVMACVDGQLYSVDDLCKAHSELKVSCQNLKFRVLNLEQNNIAYSQKLDDATKQRDAARAIAAARLCALNKNSGTGNAS
jgi:hypothetical protein